MKKGLLVLGAGPDQQFLINTAHSMNLNTIAVDGNPNAQGLKSATYSSPIDFRKTDEVINYVNTLKEKGINISGALTMGSDVPHLLAKICNEFGWIGPSTETGRIATNKLEMKKTFQKFGIPIPYFEEIFHSNDIDRLLDKFKKPIIIKPIDRSGARGVFLIKDKKNTKELLNESLEFSNCGRVMAEEYLEGLQISTESLLYDGKCITPGFADRNYEYLNRFSPRIIENGGLVPSTVNKTIRKEVELLVENASRALGVHHGITKGDVVLTHNGPKMIEMAARLSGGDFSESLVPLGVGVNYVESAIRIALDEVPDLKSLEPKFEKFVANRYFFTKPGKVIDIEGIDSVLQKEFVKKLEFWYNKNDVVPELKSHADRFGVFIVTANTNEELEENIKYVYKNINISIS